MMTLAQKTARNTRSVLRLSLHRDAYDSAFFKCSIGVITSRGKAAPNQVLNAGARELVTNALHSGFAYLYWKIPEHQKNLEAAARRLGFTPVGAVVDFGQSWKAFCRRYQRQTPAEFSVSAVSRRDRDSACAISATAFRRSRLYQMGFPVKTVDRYHAQWLANLMKDPDAVVLAARDKSLKVLGFTAVKKNLERKTLRIVLIATKQSAARKGVGSAMLQALPDFFGSHFKKILVKTQEHNRPAARFYLKRGFRPIERELGYQIRPDSVIKKSYA